MTAKRIWRQAVLAAAVLGFALLPPATARTWRQSATNLAMDYAVIIDQRPNHNAVILVWFAPPIIPDNAPALDRYVILGLVDATQGPGGVTFADVQPPVVRDGQGHVLRQVPKDELPADVAAGVAAMRDLYSNMLGQMGRGMRLFVFEPGTVHACGMGKLTVEYTGETYLYNTPIPGCPST